MKKMLKLDKNQYKNITLLIVFQYNPFLPLYENRFYQITFFFAENNNNNINVFNFKSPRVLNCSLLF